MAKLYLVGFFFTMITGGVSQTMFHLEHMSKKEKQAHWTIFGSSILGLVASLSM